MYSESSDFLEKQKCFSEMEDDLNNLGLSHILNSNKLSLEIGGAGGIFAGIVSNRGTNVISTDIVDHQSLYNNSYSDLLREKFTRNGHNLDLNRLAFQVADAQNLNYPDSTFDLVFSLNAFEHIPNPIMALTEVSRVLKPGGVFFAKFDPIWTADSGSHFLHYINEPWLHLLIDDISYSKLMKDAGATNNELADYCNAMNRLPATFYFDKFKNCANELFAIADLFHWSGCTNDDFLTHPNLDAAAKILDIPKQLLLVRGFKILAVK